MIRVCSLSDSAGVARDEGGYAVRRKAVARDRDRVRQAMQQYIGEHLDGAGRLFALCRAAGERVFEPRAMLPLDAPHGPLGRLAHYVARPVPERLGRFHGVAADMGEQRGKLEVARTQPGCGNAECARKARGPRGHDVRADGGPARTCNVDRWPSGLRNLF
jgi:hypothetical protein